MQLIPMQKDGRLLGEVSYGIYLIQNFITDEEHSYLINLCKTASESEWSRSYLSNISKEVEYNYGKEELKNIINHVDEFWIDKYLSIPDLELSFTLANRLAAFLSDFDFLSVRPFTHIQRQYAGVALAEHDDRGYDEKIKFASVLYLCEDFIGGELYFPNKNLNYRFPEKSLVIFKAGTEFTHGVREVGKGPTRYVTTSLIWDFTNK
jgi:2OG-Fe(II) oxygenase superfamily